MLLLALYHYDIELNHVDEQNNSLQNESPNDQQENTYNTEHEA